MLINLIKKKLSLGKLLKKKYYFHSLICYKSRIKLKTKGSIILIKINNNLSILKKVNKNINIKIIDNKIFLFSNSLKNLNNFSKTLSIFCKTNPFI